jgi:hypothetical protein
MSPEIFIRVGLLMAAVTIARPAAKEPPTAEPQDPEKVSVCQLKSDPAKYNHKLVEVTGFVSHGFEDFGLFEPTCESKGGIWLDYGGTKASNTMYCCGVTPGHTRPQVVSVENISIPLVDDIHFKEFDRMIQARYDLIIHATIVGRFFSGEKTPGEAFGGGYGHMGCCMLMMIQQVISVDSHIRNDLDYRASADQPNIYKAGCGYSFLRDNTRFSDLIESQRKAESGDRAWLFDDPQRVAIELLARETKIDGSLIKGLKQTRQAQGRIAYEWKPEKGNVRYMVVVSRPYVLSFYARDPKGVPWVAIAAYRIGCGSF